jgi:hypothetical protein
MVAVFCECNPDRPCDPSRSYAQLDGEYLMIPAMVVRLREVGYVGAQPEDFEGLMPLAAVARHLNPVASS